MALIFRDSVNHETEVGVWKIEENEEDVLLSFPHLRRVVASYSNPARRMEKLSAYLLLYAMQPDARLLITHNADGKPLLDGWNISVSDTRGYVAVILSKTRAVGIDIEYMSNRVNRIASRFIREDEPATSTMERLLTWSAKETVYKYFSEERLGSFDIRLHPFTLATELPTEGTVDADNLKRHCTHRVHYCLTPAYVLTYLA